jgi:CRISPR-associated protein Cmr6
MSRHLPLPSEVQDWARDHLGACSHFGLRFQTYFAYPEPWAFNGANGGKDHKGEIWAELLVHAERICKAGKAEAEAAHARRRRLAEALRAHWGPEGKVASFTGEVAWRLALGLGNEHPLENGMTLHRTLGLPYLPGSAQKGLARRYALTALADAHGVPSEPDPTKVKALRGRTPVARLDALLCAPDPRPADRAGRRKLEQAFARLAGDLGWKHGAPTLEGLRKAGEPYRRAFGSPDCRGEVCFLDALPESSVVRGKPIVIRDVVTPHHQDYYGSEGATAPADWDAPVPSTFLAVRKGAKFGFLLHGPDGAVVEQAAAWLKAALAENGFGAKTTAGYGELRVSP